MTSKKIFRWSKRQSSSDPYYRTGGLLSIDTSPDLSINGVDAKVTPKSRRRQPPDIEIVTIDDTQFCLSPPSSAITSAATNLQAVLNDLLRSPATCAIELPQRASIYKPLPGRPRSISLPLTPVELPGSILLENHGFPTCAPINDITPVRPVSQNIRRSTHPPNSNGDNEEVFLTLLSLFPEPVAHTQSAHKLKENRTEMRSVRSGNSGANPKPSPLRIKHKKRLSETGSRRNSRPSLNSMAASGLEDGAANPFTNGEESEYTSTRTQSGIRLLQPSPTIREGQIHNNDDHQSRNLCNHLGSVTPPSTTTRSKHIEELKATIAPQDKTISTLQNQFDGLKTTQEFHAASLTESHSAEIASLKNCARVAEEQLSRQPSLHHASSNDLLFVLDTTEALVPASHDVTEHSTDPGSSTSTRSFPSASEKQQRSSHHARDNPEMESLKRKLTTTRRPETANRNLLPELNQYKQNNVALQGQIESLMAKLNDAKTSEREAIRTRDEYRERAEEAEKSATSAQALQNTIDHLENRLEIANVERLDAQEQLFNVQAQKSPFDLPLLKLWLSAIDESDMKVKANGGLSMSTVFSSGSPSGPEKETQELSTLSAFVAHIERLQDQVRHKDVQYLELQTATEELQQKHEQLERDHNASNLQMEIQHDLLRKTRRTEKHVEQLRTAIIDRETVIGERDMSIRTLERQLEHHRLLLQSEVRRNAALMLHAAVENDPLPELSTLAAKKDIEKWIESLHQRLQRSRESDHEIGAIESDATLTSLRQEIDFYVREIIYYKLDIRGYKSDIKKLKRITAQLSSYGGRASDLESDSSSLKPSVTPTRTRLPATPELDASEFSSPVMQGNLPGIVYDGRPPTPPSSVSASTISGHTGSDQKRGPSSLRIQVATAPQTPTNAKETDATGKNGDLGPGLSARPAVRLSPGYRKPKLQSSGQIMSNGTSPPTPSSRLPAAPLRLKRSMSDSVVPSYSISQSPEWSSSSNHKHGDRGGTSAPVRRARSTSLSVLNKGRPTPERPPRPRFGLFPFTDSNDIATHAHPPHCEVQPEVAESSFDTNQTRAPDNPIESSVRAGEIASPAPPAAVLPPRAGSTSSTTANAQRQASSAPERKLSVASSSSIPFVIGIGSPHNPALIAPTAITSPTPCSITRYAPPKMMPGTSRAGVGGTMASSTPVTSPISPTYFHWSDAPSKTTATKTSLTRKFSLSRKQEDQVPAPPRTPSRSGSTSGSSIRTVIRLPKTKEKEADAHRMRKDSMGMQRPLGSPFDLERTLSVGASERLDGEGGGEWRYGYGVGEAI